MKALFIAIALLLALPANANGWFRVSEGRNGALAFDARVGSHRFATERGTDQPVVAVMMRVTDNGSVSYEQTYIRLEACLLGFGTLVTTNLNGDPVAKNDVVLNVQGRRSIAATIAEFLCAVAETMADTQTAPAQAPARKHSL